MCGIAGFMHYDRHKPCDIRVLRAMAESLRHRGPDGEGHYVFANVALGHRRLAIIDLNTGDQPMFSEDHTLVIVFNGEIYNYLELREELRTRGHRFRTTSDTEIILAAYQEWGCDCVTHFNGMWAFALWDGRQQTLFCSRDRAGEKPFYYAVVDGTFVFGSEIKALLAYGVPKVVNVEVLDAYLCFTYVPGQQTFFDAIYKLRPAHSITAKNGSVSESAYWDLEILDEPEARTDELQICEEFTALFENAVAIRMRSDVPFGAFLSGGLDSSCVVRAMSELSSMPVRTCTIGFENEDFDERALARLVAHRYGTEHVERLVHALDVDRAFSKLPYLYDEPFGDSSALPTYLVSQVARERVSMVLTGDGGDEVMSGYTIHVGERLASMFSHLPRVFVKDALPAFIGSMACAVPGGVKKKLLRAERVVRSCGIDFVERLESKQNGFTRPERERLISCKGVRPARDYISDAIRPVAQKSNFAKLNYWLTKVSLPDDMLCKVDRASMAHSLETRTPFLDHRIMELMATVSMDVKLEGFQRKMVLRKTVAKDLPVELLRAPKRGFCLPLGEWLRDGMMKQLEQRALQSAASGILCLEAIKCIMAEHRVGRRDAGNAIWTLGALAEHLA